MGRNNYAYALALIQSVPEKATEAFKYVTSIHEDVLTKHLMQNAKNELIAMKQAILTADKTMSTEVYAHMALIPAGSPEYQEALKVCSEYETSVIQKRELDENRKITAEEARAEREHQKELAQIESERILAEQQAKAVDDQIVKLERELEYERKGFWGSLGSRIIKGIDSF